MVAYVGCESFIDTSSVQSVICLNLGQIFYKMGIVFGTERVPCTGREFGSVLVYRERLSFTRALGRESGEQGEQEGVQR